MRNSFAIISLVVSALFALVAPAQEQPLEQGLSGRLWYAQWKDNNNYGYNPLYQAFYDLAYRPWQGTLMFGYGNGWEHDARRIDSAACIGRQLGAFVLGAGYHYVDVNVRSRDQSYSYNGPEIVAGYGLPFGKTGLSLAASATALPYVFLNYDSTYGDKDHGSSGHSWGYSGELGLHYTRRLFHAAAGYRLLQIESSDFKDGGRFHGDQFAGFFGEIGMHW